MMLDRAVAARILGDGVDVVAAGDGQRGMGSAGQCGSLGNPRQEREAYA